MKSVWKFIKTTVIGGIVFLVPLIVLIVLLAKAHELLSKAVHPIAQMVTTNTVLGVGTADIIAALLLVLIGFVGGLIAGTGVGHQVQGTVEHMILRKLPGYTLLKSVASGTLGVADEGSVKVVLATVDDAWLFAFLLEEHPDGMRTVFVPSAPTPMAGMVYFMTEAQIRRTNIRVAEAITCIMQLGVGARDLMTQSDTPSPFENAPARPTLGPA